MVVQIGTNTEQNDVNGVEIDDESNCRSWRLISVPNHQSNIWNTSQQDAGGKENIELYGR